MTHHNCTSQLNRIELVTRAGIPSEDGTYSSNQKEPMYLKLMADYFMHSKVCNSLGGTKYLPRTQQDFAVMQGMVFHAPSMFKVIGDMQCDKVWIPLIKDIRDNSWATESGEKITLLPFAPGKDKDRFITQKITHQIT